MKLNLPNNAAYVIADYDHFVQMLFNLVKNALEASDNNKNVFVTIKVVGQWVESIEVMDKGRGLSEADQKNMFKLFFTTKEEGNGLGLMMVKRVLDNHQASIDIHSKLGQGTRMLIKIGNKPKNVIEEMSVLGESLQ